MVLAHQVSVAVGELPEGRFRVEPLDMVLQAADRVWLDQWPEPMPFDGEHIKGLFVGVR